MWRNTQRCLTFALLLMVAWAAPHHDNPEEHHRQLHHSQDEAPHSHDGEDMACLKLSPHNADFAFSLYKKLESHPDAKGKNIFFSPLSISTALSMLALGAKGETHSQIFSTLGYSDLTPEQVNEGYEHLLHLLGHGHDAMLLEMGGVLAIREGFKPVDQFLKDIQHFYHGDAFSVDFNNLEVATQEINKFIAAKTNDTITDMVKDLDPATLIMLINYIYFKGKWEKPFKVEETHKADFHVDENTKVSVDMMNSHRKHYDVYMDHEKFSTIIRLPYNGNASMVVVLPDDGKMEEVEKIINREQLKYWMDNLVKRRVNLHMPKFSISTSTSLCGALKEMGIVDAFSDQADLSAISEGSKMKVSRVLHKAVLNVDEKGTEAAGATTVEIVLMSALRPTININININRPFLVFVFEYSTKSILFMGKINNPTE